MPQTLSSNYYYDPSIHQLERRHIFATAWWVLGPTDRLVSPGDYIADTVCGWPVVALQTNNGLKAFHNVCRHRAAALLPNGTGYCEKLRCPYHGWLYSFNGSLKHTSKFGITKSKQASLGLWPVNVDVWNGLAFIQIEPCGPTLREWLGSTIELVAPFANPKSLNFYDSFSITGKANWKTYCDNTVEGYHLNLVHPRLGQSLRQGSVNIVSYDDGRTVAFHVRYADKSDGTDLRGADGVWVYKFPGFQLVAGAKLFKAERVESTGPTTLRSVNWSWFGNLRESEKIDAFKWGKEIVNEDLRVCESVQTNLMAGIYQNGPLSAVHETHTARLQELVRKAIDQK